MTSNWLDTALFYVTTINLCVNGLFLMFLLVKREREKEMWENSSTHLNENYQFAVDGKQKRAAQVGISIGLFVGLGIQVPIGRRWIMILVGLLIIAGCIYMMKSLQGGYLFFRNRHIEFVDEGVLKWRVSYDQIATFHVEDPFIKIQTSSGETLLLPNCFADMNKQLCLLHAIVTSNRSRNVN